MSDKSGIEWTDATWNPIVGCSVVSPGCANCYAMRQAARIEAMYFATHTKGGRGAPFSPSPYAGTTEASKAGPVWTGKVAIVDDWALTKPLRWKRPRAWMKNPSTPLRVYEYVCDLLGPSDAPAGARTFLGAWPFWNIWLGVSAEDQRRADERIPDLLATPAAVRFVSAEPLLESIDFHSRQCRETGSAAVCPVCLGGLDWVIVGGESGPGARPMHPDWARSIRDQCAAAGVPFFFKQWGEWEPGHPVGEVLGSDGDLHQEPGGGIVWAGRGDRAAIPLRRVGKRLAGRLLDGRTHEEMPELPGPSADEAKARE